MAGGSRRGTRLRLFTPTPTPAVPILSLFSSLLSLILLVSTICNPSRDQIISSSTYVLSPNPPFGFLTIKKIPIITMSDNGKNPAVTGPKGSLPDGGLINSLEEMLTYQKAKLASMAGSPKVDPKADTPKCESGSEYSKSSSFHEGSKAGKGKKVGKRKGGKGRGGKNTDRPKSPLTTKLVVKDESAAADKEQSVKTETPAGSEYQVDVKVGTDDRVDSKASVKVEAPADIEHEHKVKSESVAAVETDEIPIDVGENDPSIKTEIKEENASGSGHGFEFKSPSSPSIKAEIKEESASGSDRGIDFKSPPSPPKTPVKAEDQAALGPQINKESSGSDYAVTTQEESPVISDEANTMKLAKSSSENLLQNTKGETAGSNNSDVQQECDDSPPVQIRQKVQILTYHRDADMYVRVRNAASLGYGYAHVRKDALISASGAMKAKFGNAANAIMMTDKDDSPFGLNVVFSILHHKYHELGIRPTISELYGLAQVVEKYDVAHVIVPFAEKWLIHDLNFYIIMAGENLNNERVMVMTWIFGEGRWFSRTLPKVAREATLQDGVLTGADGPFAGRIPDHLIECMSKYRLFCLRKLHKCIDEPLTALINGSRQYCRAGDATADIKESCNHQHLGGMISGLTIAGLVPFPEPERYQGSVLDLIQKLQSIRPVRYKVPGISPHIDTHQNCGIRHLQLLKAVGAEPIRLTNELYQDFKRRGQKTGVFSEELYNELKVEEIHPAVDNFKDDQDHFIQEYWELDFEVGQERKRGWCVVC
ncbi:hypothetical protein QC762_403720 [Podospora pseudocomata]|uniref:Uncharacterized protein n=1 Tax=Podospora pseudocomata TaxID=2093779 RepID=A0ABR0GFR5_9PEZI|nr:hypothetical protein QC762_403720 [Podospora pseudocomata]